MIDSSEPNRSARTRVAPGPRKWPLVGNPGVLRGVLPFLEKQWRRHGDVFRVRIGPQDMLVLAHPEHVHRVLVTKRHNYVKGPSYDMVRTLTGDSLLTLEGEAWRGRRTLAQPAFHRKALETLTAMMVATGCRFFDELERRIGATGQELDMHQEMVRLTLDVVIDTLFGRGTVETSQISFEALGHALELVSLNALNVRLPAWIPTPYNRRFQSTLRELDQNVYQIIRIARERESEGTLLSILLSERDEQGKPLPDKALRDEVLTLVVAGHETTALTLTWFFVLLDKRPEVLARMRDELDRVLGGAEPSFADIPKLGYVRQVVDEVLRLRGPAGTIGRDALEDDEIGGFKVPSGQLVMPFLWALHRHPDYWEDPLRFKPERFAPEASKARHQAAYMPFSSGPRICIGSSFALLEAVILLAQLVTRFDLQIGDCSAVEPVYMGSLRPSKPVRVRLTPRRRS
jgi:cytochrome P450